MKDTVPANVLRTTVGVLVVVLVVALAVLVVALAVVVVVAGATDLSTTTLMSVASVQQLA